MSSEKIGFVLCSNSSKPIPSTRIAVLNMFPFLETADLHPCIIFEPQNATETPNLIGVAERAIAQSCTSVILQKITGPNAIDLARQLTAAGIRTIFSVCDRVDLEMATVTDATIVISDFLKSLYPIDLQPRIHVVHDGIENSSVCKTDWGSHNSGIKALLVTSHDLDHLPLLNEVPAWLNIRIVGNYRSGFSRLRELRWKWSEKDATERIRFMRFLMNQHIACIPWGIEEVYKEMVMADIGIIPIPMPIQKSATALPPDWMRKSENRLTLKMAVGLPVIASPIPSYEAVIDHGRNGFLARTLHDWNTCLNALRDPALRRQMGLAARASVEHKYSMQEQARLLIRICSLQPI